MKALKMRSGVFSATFSISTPPSGLAIRTGRSRRAVDDDAEVELALDVKPFLDEHAADRPAFGPGLVRDERHAEHRLARWSPRASGPFTTLTPPPLPRPPAWICALTTTMPPPSVGRGRLAPRRREGDLALEARARRTFSGSLCLDIRGSSCARKCMGGRLSGCQGSQVRDSS